MRYADQPTLPASGDREFRYLVTDEVGCRDATQFYGVIAPGRAPDHSHVYDEVIYVLEGEGVLHSDGEDRPVSAGSCIHLPPFFVHSLENSGDTPMRIVATFHPVRRSRLARLRGKRLTGNHVSTPSATESMRRAR